MTIKYKSRNYKAEDCVKRYLRCDLVRCESTRVYVEVYSIEEVNAAHRTILSYEINFNSDEVTTDQLEAAHKLRHQAFKCVDITK